MTTFDDRERGEETKFKHDLELGFKIRNRRNKLFGLWVAQDLSGPHRRRGRRLRQGRGDGRFRAAGRRAT